MKKIILSIIILGIVTETSAQDEVVNGKLDVQNSTGTGTISQNSIKAKRYTSTTVNVTSYDKAIHGELTNYDIPANIKDSGYKIGVDGSAYASNINDFAGTLTGSYGVWARSGIHKSASGAKIEKAIAVYADLLSSQANASITNAYGVFINNGTGATSISNNYGVYQATPVAKNYFAGKVGIGTSNPSTTLDVDGIIMASSEIRSKSANPGLLFDESDVTNKNWHLQVNGGDFKFYEVDDSRSTWSQKMVIKSASGNVGIGTTNPTQKLQVAGTIYSTEVKVEVAAGQGPDYVFEADYELRTLKETKKFITENKHLPEIPPAREMEANGVDLGDMNMRLLKKIEELTLYQIELLERLEKAEQEISQLKNK